MSWKYRNTRTYGTIRHCIFTFTSAVADNLGPGGPQGGIWGAKGGKMPKKGVGEEVQYLVAIKVHTNYLFCKMFFASE